MSLSEQITRVVGGHNNALKEMLKQFGVAVPSDKKADYLPTAAAELGNRYKFDNFITGETSGLYGLPDTSVPNDVLNWIGKYNTHWWSELHGEAGIGYSENRVNVNSSTSINYYGEDVTLMYADSVTVNQSTGAVSLDDPQSITIRSANSASVALGQLQMLADLAPIYITGLYGNVDGVYYLPVGTTIGRPVSMNCATLTYHLTDSNSCGYRLESEEVSSNPAKQVLSLKYNIPAGETVYVNSTDRNAYPDNGVQDGMTYRYLGNPFTNAAKSISIECGQYVGTGTYGESNLNSITFKRVPRLLSIHTGLSLIDHSNTYPTHGLLFDCTRISTGSDYSVIEAGSLRLAARFSGNTLYWYTSAQSAAEYQLNTAQKVYYYTSIY